ncbi:RE1 [Symbiodinium sp. KB8]|nr:RE1 [Symbiodinium sp. KB8]
MSSWPSSGSKCFAGCPLLRPREGTKRSLLCPKFRIPFGTDLWNWCPVQPWPCGEVLPNSASESQEALEVASELRFMAHFVKVKDLTPSSLNVDLIVKVLASDGRLQCLSGAGLQLACVTVGDETGTVMLRLAAQQARLCEPGATLVLRSARAEMFAGQVRLELGRWSRVSALGDAALFAPKIQNDVSSKEYAVDQSQILNCQRQSREVLVLHVPLSLTDSLRPHRGFVLCGDPAWGEATDRSWRDERRDPWPKEGNDRATELFLEAVQAAAAPAGPLLAVLTGHTHGHDATVFGRSEEAGHESSSSDTVPSAVQYICEPSMRGGHRFLNVVLTSAEGPGESRDRKAESLKIVLPDSAISTPVNSMLEHGPTCSIIDMMCDLVYGTSKPEAQLILMKQVPVFSNERGQIERLTQEGRKLRRIQTCYEAWSRNKLQPSSWRSNPTALRRHSCCEPVISVLARLDMPWQCPLVPFAQCPSCESTKAQHSVPEPLGVTLSKRTAAHDLLLGLTWAAMKTAYEPGEDPEIEHDLAWRCWGGIKNLEAAAAGIELTAVADGIDAVLHRTTEAVRAGLVLVAHGLRGLLKTSTSSCQGRRIFATCESCLEAVQYLLHFLALWADPILFYSPGLRLEVMGCTMLTEFNQAIWAWQDGDWATFGYGVGKALLAANCSHAQQKSLASGSRLAELPHSSTPRGAPDDLTAGDVALMYSYHHPPPPHYGYAPPPPSGAYAAQAASGGHPPPPAYGYGSYPPPPDGHPAHPPRQEGHPPPPAYGYYPPHPPGYPGYPSHGYPPPPHGWHPPPPHGYWPPPPPHGYPGYWPPPREASRSRSPRRDGKYTCRFFIGIDNDDKFKVAKRIIGANGSNMKEIVKKSGDVAKLRLRGKGSGFAERDTNEESPEPLQLCISCPTQHGYEIARTCVEDLLLNVYDEYEDYCEEHGLECEPPIIRMTERHLAGDGGSGGGGFEAKLVRNFRIGVAEQGCQQMKQQMHSRAVHLMMVRRKMGPGRARGKAEINSGTTGSGAHSQVPTNTDEHDHDAMDEQDTRDSDLGSSTAKKDVPKTGKDHVPEYSGDSPMREYQRRVRLFEASTGIDPSYRAQKLMERLTGQAWRATESLDLDEIKHPDGVKRLLQHLWQELEPLEYLRTFTTLADFYKGFKRSPGMEYITYDMEFRAHLKRLEEIGAKIEGLTQAFWFIEKAGLSGELRKQVVAAAGGEYDYVKLRRALLAIVPRVNKEEDNGASTRLPPGGNRHWKARSNHPPRQVHATMDDGLDDAEKEQVEEAEPEMDSADLEGELEVLLTQAAKKRAQIERARGFAKNETPPEREQRIKDMKARMPCSACKAHGKTVYGHWHGDAACPYRKDKDKNVLAVVAEQLSDSDSDQEGLLGPSASDVFLATSPDDGAGEPEGNDAEEVWVGASSSVRVQGVSQLTLALSDTCCARTVAGEKWAQNHLKHLLKLREDSFVVPESRPFRFGAGPRIMSSYAIIIPVNISKADRWAHLRVSIVDQDVPLLISKTALKQLGAVLDLANGCVCFQRLSTSVPLRETRSGLCGFDINLDSSRRTCSSPPPELLEDDCEIVLSDINKHPQEGVWMTDDHPPDAGAFQQGSREAHQECESRAKELLRNHEYSYSALLDLVRRLPLGKRQRHRHINDGQGQSNIPWVAGLFVHGNMIGITKRTAKYPHVVKYINMFMRHQCDVQWSSFALQRDVCTSIHKDVHNDKAADSVTVTFGDFSGGRLWVMNQEGETSDVVWKQDPQGRSLPGRLVDTFEKPTVFSPHVPHATDDWQGERWCLTMYRTRGAAQAPPQPIMMPQVVTPKRKEDYVQAIACWSQVSVQELREHTVDRLKEIYSVLKPKRRPSALPAQWKKLDSESLKVLYASRVAKDLDRPNDNHWSRWTRSQLILEIELWHLDIQNSLEHQPDDECPFPKCSECQIPMIVRTNRVTKEEFWGCRRFPSCRITLPMEYAGRPVKEVIDDIETYDQETIKNKSEKASAATTIKKEKKDKPGIMAPRRKAPAGYPAGSNGPGVSSDGSWVQTGAIPVEEVSSGDEQSTARKFNANLTAEEIKIIEEMRRKANATAINDEPVDKCIVFTPGIAMFGVFAGDVVVEQPAPPQEAVRSGLSSNGITFEVGKTCADWRVKLPGLRTPWFVNMGGHLLPWCLDVSLESSVSYIKAETPHPSILQSVIKASGDERHYGDPMLQKALALFKKVPREATYEDLVGQPDPQEEPQNLEQEPLAQDVSHDMEVDPLNDADLPQEYARIKGHIGWHVDSKSNPVLVSYKAWAFRSPEPRYSSERFPWRTSWACINGEWRCLENEVKWLELQDCHQFVPQGPASILITIFQNRTRKEMCLDDVPHDVKRRKAQPQPHQTHAVYQGKKQTQSQTKLKRMMEKEIPYDMIPCQDRDLYKAAEEKEWQSWVDYDSCKILSLEESRQVEQERPDRILPSRYVFRNKNAGLKDTNGDPLPVKAKARLCLLGHLCPDSKSGQVQVDSPTIERVSTMIFLHLVTSYGWANNWFIGDISNAFLQGAPLEGKPDMFMRQPKQGLKGLQPGQLLKLLKPVYGRPDAPRAWYNELSRILETELGFSKSQVDPALFFLRDNQGQLKALMVVHVDDVMICHDGSALGRETAQRLHERFPFGTWLEVAKQEAGVSYCGKEIKVCEREGEQCVTLSQNAFLEGRLQPMAIDANRSKDHDMRANQTELTDYRSVVGSLQWLAVQSRPDLAFECNQLQKRVSDLRVRDLHRANKAVRDALKHRFEILFRPLGKDAELVTFHDAGLYSSLGVEIEEREAEDILQAGNERKLIYSQKGVCVGFVKRGATNAHERAHYNLIDWKSATNRRVVESSFASETHAALMGHNMSRFAQVLLAEIRFGSEVVAAVEDDGWQDLCPVTLITDCKSIYDTVHKVADGLTKGARGADIREQLERGLLFHERALKKSRGGSASNRPANNRGKRKPKAKASAAPRVEDSDRGEPPDGAPSVEEIEQLISDRNACRKRGEYSKADEIRDELKARGVVLSDEKGAHGDGLTVTSWRKKLKQIDELASKERAGQTLNAEQKGKLLKRVEVEAEIQELRKVTYLPQEQEAYNVTDPDPMDHVGVGAASTGDSQKPLAKNKKVLNLQKKLREIASLEDKKKSGESLDKLQESKIQKRQELEEQIQAALEEPGQDQGLEGELPASSTERLGDGDCELPRPGPDDADGFDGTSANTRPATEGLYMCHCIDAIRGHAGKQQRRAKYFKTQNGQSWRKEYCGAFAVQKPVTTPKTKDKAKFDLIHDFEFFLWSTWRDNFDAIKWKISDAVNVERGSFHLETEGGEKLPFDADCIEMHEVLSKRARSCPMLEEKPLVRIKIVAQSVS